LKKIIIAAVSQNGIIGDSGEMLWHSKEDFQHFKRTTMGFPVIMGRKTFESMKKPLNGRLNIIITRNSNYSTDFPEVIIFNDFTQAFELCEEKKYEKAFIIGGGEVYKQTINQADEMIISHMKLTAEGNTSFPEIDKQKWEILSETDMGAFVVIHYVRCN
jgi:dihydrofolate reductase